MPSSKLTPVSSTESGSPSYDTTVAIVRSALGRIIDDLKVIRAQLACPPKAPAEEPPEALLRIEQVASRTGVAVSTLRHWRQAGTGPPFVRIGRRVIYRAGDVDAWIEDRLSSAR